MHDRPWSIAVVDDDESLAQALVRLLRAASYRATSYSSAEKFLADPGHSQMDFLVLDIQLGGMSGFELRKRLAAEAAVPPIAFVTAHDEPETREQAWRGVCVGYFRKPFPGQRLIEVIRTTLAGKGGQPPGSPPDVPTAGT